MRIVARDGALFPEAALSLVSLGREPNRYGRTAIPAELGSFVLLRMLFLSWTIGSLPLYLLLINRRYGVQEGSVIAYSIFVVFFTFAATGSMTGKTRRPYMFTCPAVRTQASRLIWRHLAFSFCSLLSRRWRWQSVRACPIGGTQKEAGEVGHHSKSLCCFLASASGGLKFLPTGRFSRAPTERMTRGSNWTVAEIARQHQAGKRRASDRRRPLRELARWFPNWRTGAQGVAPYEEKILISRGGS
jgi:hypothetical protein